MKKRKWVPVEPSPQIKGFAARFEKLVCAEISRAERQAILPGVMVMCFGRILEGVIEELVGPEAVAPWFRAKADEVEGDAN